jgi:hypothetical protein
VPSLLARGVYRNHNTLTQHGQATQTIEVAASAQLLTTESARVGIVITEKSVSDLPLNQAIAARKAKAASIID